MSEGKVIEALVSGGQATAGPPLGPMLGPLGMNVLEIVKKINEVTEDYSGMKVPVRITVDTDTKEFEVTVGVPTTSALIAKELGISKGSGNPNTQKVGDLTMEQLIRITRLKGEELLSRDLKSGVKEILGCCVSMGVTVEGNEPKDVLGKIDQGLYDELLRE